MNRYNYIDISKGIGILMVVWAHILLVGVSHSMIYAFHMPLFFFISGFLFNKEKYFNRYIWVNLQLRICSPFLIGTTYSLSSISSTASVIGS